MANSRIYINKKSMCFVMWHFPNSFRTNGEILKCVYIQIICPANMYKMHQNRRMKAYLFSQMEKRSFHALHSSCAWSIPRRKNKLMYLIKQLSIVGTVSSSLWRLWSPFLSSWLFFRTFPLRLCGIQGCILIKGGAKGRKITLII